MKSKTYTSITRTWGGKNFSESKEFDDLPSAQKFAESGGSGYVVNKQTNVGRMFTYELGWKRLSQSDTTAIMRDLERGKK